MAVAMSKILLSLTPSPPPTTIIPKTHQNSNSTLLIARRIILTTIATSFSNLLNISSVSLADTKPTNSFLSAIVNTKSWFQFYGNGFTIRVPPSFVDMAEPEDYNEGLSLYGDKVKPKTYAARFATPDGSEVVSVVTRSTNSLKITFLEAKDISDLGTLKEVAKIFVPVGAALYSARAFKIKEDEGYRNYYYYEFGRYGQHIALVAAVSSGKAYIAGASAPDDLWNSNAARLRSAAVSLTLL